MVHRSELIEKHCRGIAVPHEHNSKATAEVEPTASCRPYILGVHVGILLTGCDVGILLIIFLPSSTSTRIPNFDYHDPGGHLLPSLQAFHGKICRVQFVPLAMARECSDNRCRYSGTTTDPFDTDMPIRRNHPCAASGTCILPDHNTHAFI